MSFEVPTGAGKMDLCITHNQRKYIVETKIWRGDVRYQTGKQQLAVYLKSEGVTEGYYVVFDHRQKPEPRVETETVDGVSIRSYIIPVYKQPLQMPIDAPTAHQHTYHSKLSSRSQLPL